MRASSAAGALQRWFLSPSGRHGDHDPGVRLPGVTSPLSSASTRAHVKALVAAKGQTNPTNLWDARPLPQVVAAVDAVKRSAPLPKAFVPSMANLERENTHISYDIPPGCEPSFGSGVTSRICHLGDASSKRVVAVLGDSHAQMWTPALIAAGRRLGFAVVLTVKPGCCAGQAQQHHPEDGRAAVGTTWR